MSMDKQEVAKCVMMYSLGRNVQYYDAPALRAILRAAGAGNNTFASLVLAIVKSTPFQMREAQGQAKRPVEAAAIRRSP